MKDNTNLNILEDVTQNSDSAHDKDTLPVGHHAVEAAVVRHRAPLRPRVCVRVVAPHPVEITLSRATVTSADIDVAIMTAAYNRM